MRATRETAQEQPDGTWIVGLRLDPDDALRLVSAVALGHTIHLALPGQAQAVPESRAPVQHVGLPDGYGIDASSIGPASMDPESAALIRQAGSMCESARFHRWLIDVHGVSMVGPDGNDIARTWVLHWCGAQQPEQLIVGASRVSLTAMLEDFRQWEARSFKSLA